MSEHPTEPSDSSASDSTGTGPGTDISAADLDVVGNDERPETSDPEAFQGDETLGGLGGADQTEGGDG